MHRLEEGQDNDQIIQEFDGDSQLVQFWNNFLVHNHWIKNDELGEITVRGKGGCGSGSMRANDTDSLYEKFMRDIESR